VVAVSNLVYAKRQAVPQPTRLR